VPSELDVASYWVSQYRLPITVDELRGLRADELWAFVLDRAKAAGYLAATIEQAQIDPYWRLLRSNARSLLRYVPRPYARPLTLLAATDQRLGRAPIVTTGWAALARGGIDIQEVPGNHETIMEEPRVRALADRLRACIDNAVVGER
jgi:thioesterase domain-containing protein